MMHRGALSLFSVIAMFGPAALHAEDSVSREAALFDRPAAVRSVPPKTDNDPAGEIRCTYYGDFMVRETGTDSPAPGPAAIIPAPDAGRRPACNAAPAARTVPLKTEEHALLGRKGPFLVFEAADPYGAVPFIVLDANTGRLIYSDGKHTDGLRSVALEGGALRIRYPRAFNGACSIIKDEAGCWSKIALAANVPPALAQSPPPVPACTTAYRRAEAPADGPSMIIYDLDVTLDISGRTQVNSFGTVGCEPMP